MNADPFTPPSHCRTTTGEFDVVRISKAAILSMILKTPFDDISSRKDLATDDETTMVSFLEAIVQALIIALVQYIPQKSSPKKLLSYSLFQPGPHLCIY